MKASCSRVFLREVFNFETEVNELQQELWDTRVETEYSAWINQLAQTKPELFRLELKVSQSTKKVLEYLTQIFSYPSQDNLVNKLIKLYIDEAEPSISPFPFANVDDLAFPLPITINPVLMRETLAISSLTSMPHPLMLSEMLNQMAQLVNTEKAELRVILTKDIYPKLIHK